MNDLKLNEVITKIENDPFFKLMNDQKNEVNLILFSLNFIERNLYKILIAYFKGRETKKNVLSHKGFLGEFVNKAKMCYLLNIISKDLLYELNKLAEIRNELAHTTNYEHPFNRESIKNKISELKIWENRDIKGNVKALQTILSESSIARFRVSVAMCNFFLGPYITKHKIN